MEKTAKQEHPHAESAQNPTKRKHVKQHTEHAANAKKLMKLGVINALNELQKESD